MATKALSSAQLLTCSDADFDNNIRNMSVKGLMELISSLQKEMAREQENFNGLTSSLHGLKDRNSRQYKTINRDMMASQTRLTTLMNRSMKCFSQQSVQQTSQGVQLRRRNSAKSADSPNTSPSKSTSVQRSRSLHATNQPNSTDVDPTSTTNSQTSTAPAPRPTSAQVVLRGGVSRALGSKSSVQQQQRPASVAGVNGVVANSNTSSAPRVSVASAAGASSSSTTSLNIQPQPMVMGTELTTRSKSQILVTPSTASSQPPPASASTPSSNTQEGYAGLPSVRQLAQNFGAKPSSAGGQTSTNYRPVIRAQSMAASDATRSMDNIHVSSASSKVNGIPGPVMGGGRLQGQYIKRMRQPSQGSQLTGMRKAQSREELYAIESRTRVQKDALLREIESKQPA
ncbi:hypothetical protein BaRGS_00014777, partial [Batillaria attramentaria]